jgi:hypothetical protein
MLTELLGYIKEIEAIVASEADWKYKYGRVFKLNSKFIMPLIEDLGIQFNYFDPDEDFEADVLAYMKALAAIKENIEMEIVSARKIE